MTQLLRCLAKLRFVLLLSSLCWTGQASAHEVLPAVGDLYAQNGVVQLEIRLNLEALLAGINLDGLANTDDAEEAQAYDALRTQPGAEIAAQAGRILAQWNALPLLSGGGEGVLLRLDSAITEEARHAQIARVTTLRLSGELSRGTQSISVNWPQGAGALVLRQQGVEDPYTGYLGGGSQSPEIDLKGGGAQTGWQAFLGYIPVGFDHIVPKGLDHILFVLGLFLLSTRLGPLLWQISAFTLAHTVTLALGALGWVTVNAAIVEPLIAASIVYVAVENIFSRGLTPWRPAVVFAFGLLHGLGFASVLGEFGLPDGVVIPALLGFNIGVELGQLAVVAIAALLLWLSLQVARIARLQGDMAVLEEWPVLFRAASIIGSLTIGLIGAYWVIERVFL